MVHFRKDWKQVYVEADIHKSMFNKKDLIFLVTKYITSKNGNLYKTKDLKKLTRKNLQAIWYRNKPLEFRSLIFDLTE